MGSSKFRRVKWYQCFRPERRDTHADAGIPFYENGGKEKNGYIDKDLMMRNTILVALSDDDESGSFSEDRRCRKSRSRRGISRAFKAVMSPIVSVRKSRSKKSDREKPQFRSNSSSVSSRIEKMLQSFGSRNSSSAISKDNTFSDSHRTDSSATSLFSNTTAPLPSSAASSRSNSRSTSERKNSLAVDLNPVTFHGSRKCFPGGCCKTMLGLYFLFVCLLALVLCGKALAVFCTSSSLFLIPCCLKKISDAGDGYYLRRWRPFVYSVADPVDYVVVDCDKKVVGVQ